MRQQSCRCCVIISREYQYYIYIFFFTTMKRMMMFAFTMMMAFVAFAQKSPGTLTLYPRVGMSFSKFCGDKIYTDILNSAGGHVDAKFKTGFTAGAELQYQLSDIIALSGGVIYSEQGTKFGSIEGIDDVEIKHNDINVPLLFVLTTKYGFSLKAGLQPEFRVSDKFDKILNEVNLSIPVGMLTNTAISVSTSDTTSV